MTSQKCMKKLFYSSTGFLVLNSIYVLEYVGTSWRSTIGFIPFWAGGVIILGGLYSLLPNWRHLCIITGALGLPFVIFMWWVSLIVITTVGVTYLRIKLKKWRWRKSKEITAFSYNILSTLTSSGILFIVCTMPSCFFFLIKDIWYLFFDGFS